MRCLIVLTFLLTMVLVPIRTAAQQKELENIVARFDSLNSSYPQEKIHINFDKPYYAIGDTIWFKVYLTSALHTLTDHSGVLYVDLIDGTNEIKKSLIVPLIAGLGSADFVLSSGFHEGIYRVRAYTNWMRNFSPSKFFNQLIPIADPLAAAVSAKSVFEFSGSGMVANLELQSRDNVPIAAKEIHYQIGKQQGGAVTDSAGRSSFTITDTAGILTIDIPLEKQATIKKIFTVVHTQKPDLQFFPEGGELIENIPCRMAFKITGADGLGVTASGYVEDNDKQKVASFKTAHAGMGMLSFTPRKGKSYRAVIEGMNESYPLPSALAEGYSLSVDLERDSIAVRTMTSLSLVNKKGAILVIRKDQKIYWYLETENPNFRIKIPKKPFPAGIIQITLLTSPEMPVAERLVFLTGTQLDIETSQLPDSKVGSKIDLSLQTKNATGKDALSSLSIAVVDNERVPYDEQNEMSIQSNLLLSSELRGYIEKPNYYFIDTAVERIDNLDLLMLTQGWRRFEWKEQLEEKEIKISYRPEHGLSLRGKLSSGFGGILSLGRVDLIIPRGGLRTAITDEEGNFVMDSLDYEDQTKLTLKYAGRTKNIAAKVKLENFELPTIEPLSTFKYSSFNMYKDLSSYLNKESSEIYEQRLSEKLANMQVLEEVRVKTNRVHLPNSDNLNGGGNADFIVMGDQLKNQTFLAEALRAKAPIVIDNGNAYTQRVTKFTKGILPMAVFIDGVEQKSFPVDDKKPNLYTTPLNSVDVNDIESVEILTNLSKLAVYGSSGFSGIILVTTKKKAPMPESSLADKGIMTFAGRGYAPQRHFYSPVYEMNNAQLPKDKRSTIYWNPNILTDKSGKADVSFFASKNPGLYRYTIEGIDEYGHIGRKVFTQKIIR